MAATARPRPGRAPNGSSKRREEAARTGDTNMSQMHFARKGLLTEEMLFVAERERVSPELIRDEVAAGA